MMYAKEESPSGFSEWSNATTFHGVPDFFNATRTFLKVTKITKYNAVKSPVTSHTRIIGLDTCARIFLQKL